MHGSGVRSPVHARAPGGSRPGAASTPRAPESTLEPRLAQALDAAFRALTATQRTAVSVGVLAGDARWVGAYGFADVEKRVPATATTSYRMASVAKTFTALSVMQLVEEGKLALDAEIQTYVPSFPRKRWPVTVRQLLGHLGGVSHYRGFHGEDRLTTHHDTAQALALFQDWELVAEPGTRFVYSSYGFNLLAAAVEAASGQPFGDYLAQHLFTPLGMTRSDLERPAQRNATWAAGYTLRRGVLERSAAVDISSRFGGGGARSTVEDLLRFSQALLDGAVVGPRSWRSMQTVQVTRDGTRTDYGLGFSVFPQRGHYVVSHAGGQPETSTLLLLIPTERFAIALASNLEGNDALLSEMATTAQEVLLDGGARRRPAYADDPADALLYEGLSRVHTYGLALRDFHRGFEGPEEDIGSLPPGEAPFEKVSGLLSTAALLAPDGRARILSGHQPHDGEPLARAGEEMAQRIEEVFGQERLVADRSLGPLAFFGDYLKACEQVRCPPRSGFSDELRAQLERLGPSWANASPPWLRTLRLDAKTDRVALERLLRLTMERAPLRPDLAPELSKLGLELSAAGKARDGRALIELALELYPDSADARLALVDAFLLTDDLAAARTTLSEAAQRSRVGVSPALLQRRAEQLRRWGQGPAASKLLKLSGELAVQTSPP